MSDNRIQEELSGILLSQSPQFSQHNYNEFTELESNVMDIINQSSDGDSIDRTTIIDQLDLLKQSLHDPEHKDRINQIIEHFSQISTQDHHPASIAQDIFQSSPNTLSVDQNHLL